MTAPAPPPALRRDELRSATAFFVGAAAVCAACGARTELGAWPDASTRQDASEPRDASVQDHASVDAPADAPPDGTDAATADVSADAPCAPPGGECSTSADCCDPNVAVCVAGRCEVALYGAPPPPK